MSPPARIALVGPESTGKTTLARDLAVALGEPWVPEFARAWLEDLGRAYVREDLVTIARGQLEAEARAEGGARRALICDTNLLVVRIWSEVRFGGVDPWIAARERLDRYALHLLTAPDLPWAPDPLRESPHELDALFARYEAALVAAGVPYRVVRGVGPARLDAALAALAEVPGLHVR